MVLFSRSFVRKRMISLATTASLAATSFALADDPVRERSFVSENATTMSKMMTGMTVKPTGDVDRDFVAMMVPHHQGAVDMAQAELKYGHNEQLRRLAREIVATQQQEIMAMRAALSDGHSSAAQSPEQSGAQLPARSSPVTGSAAHPGMNMSQ